MWKEGNKINRLYKGIATPTWSLISLERYMYKWNRTEYYKKNHSCKWRMITKVKISVKENNIKRNPENSRKLNGKQRKDITSRGLVQVVQLPNNRSSRRFRKNQPTNQRSHHILQGNFLQLKYVCDWKESSKYSAQLMRIVSL